MCARSGLAGDNEGSLYGLNKESVEARVHRGPDFGLIKKAVEIVSNSHGSVDDPVGLMESWNIHFTSCRQKVSNICHYRFGWRQQGPIFGLIKESVEDRVNRGPNFSLIKKAVEIVSNSHGPVDDPVGSWKL